jgi:hypothetical protein
VIDGLEEVIFVIFIGPVSHIAKGSEFGGGGGREGEET